MGKIIKEDIKYNVIKTRNGKQMIYIMATNSQSNDLISANQETLKKFGAVYNPQMRKWVWWLSGDESEIKKQIAAYVYPCIKEIIAQETIDKGGELDSNIQNTINTLLNDINKVLKTSLTSDDLNGTDEKIDINAIKHEIMAFKEKLVKITSSEEFKKVFGPIIEFSKVMGPGFSLINCILIMIQDPEATLVKSRGNWKFSNREVVSGAKPIALYMPHGEKKYKSPASRKIATAKFLLNKGVKRVEDLTPGDRETLNKELNRVVKVEFWTLEPNWFDHRFTRVMNNKEDLAPIGSKQRDKNTQIYDEIIKSYLFDLIFLYTSATNNTGSANKNKYISSLNGTLYVCKNLDKTGTSITITCNNIEPAIVSITNGFFLNPFLNTLTFSLLQLRT